MPSEKRKANDLANIYAHQMFSAGHGLALWRPEAAQSTTNPDIPCDVLIGDVGFVNDGKFVRLFNATRPASDPINQGNSVPAGFAPLTYHHSLQRRREGSFGNHPICSKNVSYVELGSEAASVGASTVPFQVSCLQGQGAMLLVHNDTKESVIPNEAFKRYMLDHHQTWCEKARALGHSVPDEDIILVLEVSKACEWTIAAWDHDSEASAGAEGAGVVTGGGRVGKVLLAGSSVASRTSLEIESGRRPQQPNHQKHGHCIFLSYYRMKKRLDLIGGGSGLHQLSLGDRANSSDTPRDPLDDALNYILEKSDAEVAISSHLDIRELLGEGDWPEKFGDYLKEREPPLDVDEKKVGSLSMVAAIQRCHAEEVEAAKQSLRARLPAPPPQEPPPEQEELVEDAEDAEAPPGPDVPEQGATQEIQGDQAPETPTEDHMDVDIEDAPKVLVAPAQGPRDISATGRVILGGGRGLDWPHHVLDGAIDGEAGSVISSSISKDGSLFAAGYDDPRVRVWDIQSGSLAYQLRGHSDQVLAMSFSPRDGTKLVTGSADANAIMWDLRYPQEPRVLVGHDGNVWAVAFSPDGEIVATGSADSTVKLWNANTGDLLNDIDGHPDAVLQVLFSPAGRHILVSSGDVALLWDTQDLVAARWLSAHTDLIWSTAFSHDSKRIITGSSDKTGRVWSAETGDELVIIREHADDVSVVGFSPDSKRVVLGSEDGTLTICDSYDGSRHFHLKELSSEVTAAVYSPDGELVVSGSASGTVKVWDANRGTLVAELHGHKENYSIRRITFTPDNERFISSCEDGTSRVWRVSDIFRVC